MNDTIRIAFVVNNLASGGAQRQLMYLANGFHARKYEVHVFVLSCATIKKRFFVDSLAPDIHFWDLSSEWTLRSLLRLINLFRTIRPGVIYNFLESANLVGSLCGRAVLGRRVAILNSLRGIAPMNFRHIGIWRHLCNCVVTNSNVGANRLAYVYRYPTQKVHVVHNCIDFSFGNIGSRPQVTAYLPECRNAVICVGRIAPVKNQELLLEALGRMTRTERPRIALVGRAEDEEYSRHLQSRINSLGIDRVAIVGEIDRMADVYRQALLLVQCSTSESLPNAVIEALASGLPVIASDVGDTAQLVDHGTNGYLYPSGDADALASRIAAVVASPSLRQLLADGAVRSNVANRFSVAACLDSTEDIITAIRASTLAMPATRSHDRVKSDT